MEDKIFKLTGTLFSNEKGFEINEEVFEISDENTGKLVVKDENFTTLSKEPCDYGFVLGETKFDSSYEAFSLFKGVLFWRGDSNKYALAALKVDFEHKIAKEIHERNSWIKKVKNEK